MVRPLTNQAQGARYLWIRNHTPSSGHPGGLEQALPEGLREQGVGQPAHNGLGAWPGGRHLDRDQPDQAR